MCVVIRLSFVVHGPPVPKARARVVSRVENGKTKTRGVTPAKTRDYEKLVNLCALGARLKHGAWPHVERSVHYGIKLRVFRSRDAGDLDNYVKAVSDACNGVLWLDDSQIRRIDAMVDGCEKGRERVEVEVWTLG